MIGGLNARRGTIIDSEVREDEFSAVAEVALNDMFGYSSQLRGATQGKGEFSMEYKVSFFCFRYHTYMTDCPWICVAESHAGAPERAG